MFRPSDPKVFFSKNDPNDRRLGDFVQPLGASNATVSETQTRSSSESEFSGARLSELIKQAIAQNPIKKSDSKSSLLARPRRFALAGYCDDEGIRLNGGRLGAKDAPPAIRKHLYKMTPSVLSDGAGSGTEIFDVGNLVPGSETLGERHAEGRALALAAMDAGCVWLSLGGGHDYGFADAAAFGDWSKKQGARPLVINFDAHLDVRPYRAGKGDKQTSDIYSSGTPFSRYLDEFPESDFFEVGLQGQCNSSAHLEWLKNKGGRTLFLEEIEASGETLADAALARLGGWVEKRRPAFLSVDIDAFSNAYAPGCSQSFATGLEPQGFFALLQILLRRLDVRGLGIYETSPALDENERTSRLAALILHRALFPI